MKNENQKNGRNPVSLKKSLTNTVNSMHFKKIKLNQFKKGSKFQENNHIEVIKWEDVRIGDILRVQHNEIAPADMILLDSNVIRDKLPVCYINTLQTDGKENRKEIKASILTKSKSTIFI